MAHSNVAVSAECLLALLESGEEDRVKRHTGAILIAEFFHLFRALVTGLSKH